MPDESTAPHATGVGLGSLAGDEVADHEPRVVEPGVAGDAGPHHHRGVDRAEHKALHVVNEASVSIHSKIIVITPHRRQARTRDGYALQAGCQEVSVCAQAGAWQG